MFNMTPLLLPARTFLPLANVKTVSYCIADCIGIKGRDHLPITDGIIGDLYLVHPTTLEVDIALIMYSE